MLLATSTYLVNLTKPQTPFLCKISDQHYTEPLISSVQSLSCVRLFATPWTTAHQASLSITSSWSLLKLTSIASVMPFNHLTLYHSLLLLSSIFLCIRVFSKESVLHVRRLKYCSFSFNISPSNASHDTRVQSLGQEGFLEKEMATHYNSCLENPMKRGVW